jgi:hypothetical protein
MAIESVLSAERNYLASLLEAIQRCVYFLNAASQNIPWPLTEQTLQSRKKDNELFESLAAVNERFSKLQDSLGAAMRHSLTLSGEQADSFIKVLAIFEKFKIISSIEDWQLARTARNLAAHDYQTDYAIVAEHFNTLRQLTGNLYGTSKRFVIYCADQLSVFPLSDDFAEEFKLITEAKE